jgi:hypothetical protein
MAMAENPTKGSESLEKELLHTLRFGGLDKENLNELVSIVAGLRREGLERIKVFVKGIPVPEGLNLQAFVDAGRLSSILTRILMETPRLQGVSVFPYGIPRPEVFQISVELGESTGQAAAVSGIRAAA